MSKTDLNNIVQNISFTEDSDNLLNNSDISDSDNANWNPFTDGTAEKYANEVSVNDSNIWDNISENKNTKQKSKEETVNKLDKITVVSNIKESAANVLINNKMEKQTENKTNKNRDFNIFDENDIINKFFYVGSINTKKIKTKDKSSFINNIGKYINYCNNCYFIGSYVVFN